MPCRSITYCHGCPLSDRYNSWLCNRIHYIYRIVQFVIPTIQKRSRSIAVSITYTLCSSMSFISASSFTYDWRILFLPRKRDISLISQYLFFTIRFHLLSMQTSKVTTSPLLQSEHLILQHATGLVVPNSTIGIANSKKTDAKIIPAWSAMLWIRFNNLHCHLFHYNQKRHAELV